MTADEIGSIQITLCIGLIKRSILTKKICIMKILQKISVLIALLIVCFSVAGNTILRLDGVMPGLASDHTLHMLISFLLTLSIIMSLPCLSIWAVGAGIFMVGVGLELVQPHIGHQSQISDILANLYGVVSALIGVFVGRFSAKTQKTDVSDIGDRETHAER